MRATWSGLLFLALAVPATADLWPDHLVFEPDQVPITLTVVPDGSGPDLAGARRDDGTPWGRPLRVQPWLVVWGGGGDPQPVAGFPAEDVRLASDAEATACPGHGHPDGPSDPDGWFTWSHPIAAGGDLAAGASTHLVMVGLTFAEPLPLSFRSPDLDGDRVVNLSDIVAFAAALSGAPGAEAADFNLDGVVNLTDIVVFAPAIGAVCP